MTHWQFQNAQSCTRGAHLHLEIPPVGFFLHPESIQRLPPDRPERTHVGIANTVEKSQKNAGDAAGEDLLEVHASRFALSACARTDHEILFLVGDGLHELSHQLGAIAPVPIEKHNYLAFGRQSADSSG